MTVPKTLSLVLLVVWTGAREHGLCMDGALDTKFSKRYLPSTLSQHLLSITRHPCLTTYIILVTNVKSFVSTFFTLSLESTSLPGSLPGPVQRGTFDRNSL